MKNLFTVIALCGLGFAGASAAQGVESNQRHPAVDKMSNAFSEVKSEMVYDYSPEALKAKRLATKAEDWEYLGTGTYRECLLASVFINDDPMDLPVEMYQSSDDYSTIYKLENVYSAWPNHYSDVTYDFEGEYDMFIHVFNIKGTDYIFIEDFDTGLFFEGEGFGEMYLITQAGYSALNNPENLEVMLGQWTGCFGELHDGIMTYPMTMQAYNQEGQLSTYYNFLIGFSDDDNGYYGGNTKKAPFTVVLPGYEIPELPDPFEDAYVYIGQGMFYNNLMTPFLEVPRDEPYEVGIYREEGNPYYFHIRNAWGQWHDAAGKDTDFFFYFPYDSESQSWNINVAAVPYQTTGYDDIDYGVIYIMGIAYYYATQGTTTEDGDHIDLSYEEVYELMPDVCIYVDLDAKRIIFPQVCVMYDYDYNDTGVFQDANPNYTFQGYIQFPSDYEFQDPNRGDEPGSVSGLITDNDNTIRFYNLNGVEINNPAKGQIVIKKQGGKTSKFVVR